MPARAARPTNSALIRLIETSGASHAALAHRVNALCRDSGVPTAYTHTSVANWRAGMVPAWPVPKLIAQALSERLDRPVTVADIAMAAAEPVDADAGLGFPRDLRTAITTATTFWSTAVNRRDFLASSGFAVGAFNTPFTRWLIRPTDPHAAHQGGVRVGAEDVRELREAADQARHWDSRYGGGNWRAGSVEECLRQSATPLLHGTYSTDVGRDLFSVSAELSRLAGFAAFDTGRHQAAQRHFVQALRLARAAGNTELGCFIVTTMAMQALMRGFHDTAIDMTEGAYERSKEACSPRVLAFTKLIEARAHARDQNPRAASAALAASETLIGRAQEKTGHEPHWIDFYSHARLSADATEIYRDLHQPDQALRWNRRAAAMPRGSFTRSVGMRLAIVGTVHIQQGDLERGLDLGHQAVTILSRVESQRAQDYVHEFTAALTPWRREPQVRAFLRNAGSAA